jgi:hypothetical protein
MITYQNWIREEIKTKINSGNACYHEVQIFLYSRLLAENVKFKIYCNRPPCLGHAVGRPASMILALREYTGAWEQVE